MGNSLSQNKNKAEENTISTDPMPNPDLPESHHEEFGSSSKDVSMTDVTHPQSDDGHKEIADDHLKNMPPLRRRSTLILTEDIEFDKLNLSHKQNDGEDSNQEASMNVDGQAAQSQQAQQQQQGQQPGQYPPSEEVRPPEVIPVEISWVQGGEKVYVTGSFTGWRKMIGLIKLPDGTFQIKLALPIGTHRFRFVVDNELRFSDYLPTATDQMGNFVNYIEVVSATQESDLMDESITPSGSQQSLHSTFQQALTPVTSERRASVSSQRVKRAADSKLGLTQDDDDMGGGYSRYHDDENVLRKNYQYITDIPAIFTDPAVMEQYYITLDNQSQQNQQQQAWLTPPQLPPHLESVILNNFSNDNNNSGALPIPNHVVLNHLATTSIKHNTLAVASVVRYQRKYVTQILYAPLQ